MMEKCKSDTKKTVLQRKGYATLSGRGTREPYKSGEYAMMT